MKNQDTREVYRIRPSARLINTIGKDLVKDKFAAIVELVKNSYDADSEEAKIKFVYQMEEKTLEISINDSGHGMDLDTVVNKWLVPATPDKLDRRVSKKGRALQGRKGIGRFAAAALGDSIYLNTRAEGDKEVSLLLDLNDFSSEKFLEDVPVIIDEEESSRAAGTYLEVVSTDVSVEELNSQWDEKQRSNLFIELSKLLAPSEVAKVSKELGYLDSDDHFKITVEYKGFPDRDDFISEIKPLGIISLYDYRISGTIDAEGNARFEYSNQNIPSLEPEKYIRKIVLEDKITQAYPGTISFDIRVFDRDPESIDDLINRGLTDPFSEEKVGKRKAREILNAYYGVSLFRGNFRVRPYGNKDFDWLELDKNRIQNPSMKIGHNQVIGFIGIQSEEKSHLEEKSARDGLVEDKYYRGLKFIILYAMTQLEERRFEFREKSFRGRKIRSINEQVEDLFSFESVTNKLSNKISALDIDNNYRQAIVSLVTEEINTEKKRKSKEYQLIKDTIALYQGQATLGKITHIVLHEGRKHIKVINEVPNRLVGWVKDLSKNFNDDKYDKLISRSELLVKSSKAIALLFKRLEPLAVAKRPNRRELNLYNEVLSSINIFEFDLASHNISIHLDIPKSLKVFATSFDLAAVFANLVENSIYWLGRHDVDKKEMRVEAYEVENGIELVFSDNGPGFQGSNVELMFEPGFSMRPGGTGLGLALVGEALSRVRGNIRAVDSDLGACFVISFNGEQKCQ